MSNIDFEELIKDKSKIVYEESASILRRPKDIKPNTDNLPDMKKVKAYYQKRGK